MKGKKMVILTFLMLGFGVLTIKLPAQSISSFTNLTLERAIKLSKENHPSLQAAKLNVKLQEKSKKMAFDLDKTNITYTRGQLNSSVIDYNWQIMQSFKFPTTYLSLLKLHNEKIELSRRKLAITELELELNVRKAWWKLAYGQERSKVLNELTETYKGFADAAAKRLKAGETNVLEKINAESQYQKILLQQRKAKADLLIYENQLRQWLGIDTRGKLPAIDFIKLAPPVRDTSVLNFNPVLSYYRQNIDVTKQQFRVAKSDFLPDLSVGYFNQQIENIKGMTGVKFGVNFPLFFFAQQGKSQSAKLSNEIALTEYKNYFLRLLRAYQTLEQELAKYQSQVEWFEANGLKNADELLRFAEKAYLSGEIGYVEYINSTDQAINIKLEYLNALHQYNQRVIDLQYLSGRF